MVRAEGFEPASYCIQEIIITKNNGLVAVDSVFPAEPYLYCESASVVIKVRFGLCWWMIRGSNTILSDFPNRSKH